jgi:hypothetical protein
MFEKVLIAHRGDQPPAGGAAAKLNRAAAEGSVGGFAARIRDV